MKEYQVEFVVTVIVPHTNKDDAALVAQGFVENCVIITEEPAYITDAGVDPNPVSITELDENGDPIS